ncbi:hypothetical protein P879_11256 [Paragonimus westermani]|uniref:Uncharacterized protein n=1 Tax=Paragonimus westermani TaxID=34504 RepID=A0A8T0DBT8_9TREM|nr:hypothetical protein P879_11256 [Paragonimus westermani]
MRIAVDPSRISDQSPKKSLIIPKTGQKLDAVPESRRKRNYPNISGIFTWYNSVAGMKENELLSKNDSNTYISFRPKHSYHSLPPISLPTNTKLVSNRVGNQSKLECLTCTTDYLKPTQNSRPTLSLSRKSHFSENHTIEHLSEVLSNTSSPSGIRLPLKLFSKPKSVSTNRTGNNSTSNQSNSDRDRSRWTLLKRTAAGVYDSSHGPIAQSGGNGTFTNSNAVRHTGQLNELESCGGEPHQTSGRLLEREDNDTNEDEEGSHRDRYFSVMEELFKKHKEPSTRTTRTLQGLGSAAASVVPGRRIQAIAIVPEDPMMKFTGRHIQHSLGFKLVDKSDSLIVEPDREIMRQVKLLQEYEQKLTSYSPQTQFNQVAKPAEIAKSSARLLRQCSCSLQHSHKTDSHRGDEDEEKETIQSELDSLSSRASTPVSANEDKSIDEKRVYLHFNPVVQIYPNQSPWRFRSRIRGKFVNEENVSLTGTPEAALVTTVEAAGTIKRLNSVKPSVMRAYSMDKNTDPRNAFQSLIRNQTLMSSTNVTHSLSSLSVDSGTGSRLSFHRRTWSASDTTLFLRPSVLPTTRGSSYSGTECDVDQPFEQATEAADYEKSDKEAMSVCNNVPRTTKLSVTLQEIHKEAVNSKLSADPEDPHRLEEQIEKLRSTSSAHCADFILTSADPNRMAWFDLLDERLTNSVYRSTFREKLMAHFRLKGLAKRFIAIPNGMLGLQQELEKGWEIRPKPEFLMKCVVKHHVLKMPMTLQNSPLVEKIYMNSIVRHPGLYKLLMRRREILPQELQHFLNRIMEMTETSDRMMATITNSTTKLTAITSAAKEMDASGFMTGGPKVPQVLKETHKSSLPSRPSQRQPQQLAQESSLQMPKEAEKPDVKLEAKSMNIPAKRDGGFCSSYGKETDFDKGFYTVLRNPCANILEEVALYLPEFAWHIRPLFEHLWANLEDDLLEKLIDKHMTVYQKTENMQGPSVNRSSSVESARTRKRPTTLGANGLVPSRHDLREWPETYELCVQLFKRVPIYFSVSRVTKPGDGILHDLLICLHMSNYYSKLASLLVNEMDSWIPCLLNGLESTYSSVREETCCVLSYLVCAYRLITKLHVISKNLLVANITFSLLSAIGRYPESYAFYHGVLGYMLHSLPCLSILDCLLLWLPTVEHDEKNLVSRDWALFVYYIIRHWPRNPFYLDTLYQKKLLKPLEASFLTKHSKRPARLALSYLVRTCNVRSALLTCWPDNEEMSV